MEIYFRNEREFTAYQVTSLTSKHSEMNSAYESGDFGKSINYARTLIESTCKYVYHELKGKELEEIEGRLDSRTGEYFANLNTLITKSLNELKALVQYPEQLDYISEQIENIVNKIGNIRNGSALSHGSRIRNAIPRKAETRFIISIAEDVCMLLMDLLQERTILEKKNALGSIIDSEGMHKYGHAYQTEDEFMSIRYETSGQIIFSVLLTFKKPFFNLESGNESINEHVRDFLPDDVFEAESNGKNQFKYYSNRQDRYYDEVIEETDDNILVTIDSIEIQRE